MSTDTPLDGRLLDAARTDTHLRQIEGQMAWHQQQADSDATAEPLRQRHRQRLAALQSIVADHHATRRASTHGCGSDTERDRHAGGTAGTKADAPNGESGQ